MPDLVPIYKSTLANLNVTDWNQRYKNSYVLLNKQIQFVKSVVTRGEGLFFAIPKPPGKDVKKELAHDFDALRAFEQVLGLDNVAAEVPPPPDDFAVPRAPHAVAFPGIPHGAAIGNDPIVSQYLYTAVNVERRAVRNQPTRTFEFRQTTDSFSFVMRLLSAQQHWWNSAIREEEYKVTLERQMLRALTGDAEKYRPMIRAFPGELWEFVLLYMKNVQGNHLWMHLDFNDDERVNETIRGVFIFLANKLTTLPSIQLAVDRINHDVNATGVATHRCGLQLFRSLLSDSVNFQREADSFCHGSIRWPSTTANWAIDEAQFPTGWLLREALTRYRNDFNVANGGNDAIDMIRPMPRRLATQDIENSDFLSVNETEIELTRPRSRWFWSKGSKGQELAVFMYSPNHRQFTRGLTPENACTMYVENSGRHAYPRDRLSQMQKDFYQDAYLKADVRPVQRPVTDIKRLLKDRGLSATILCPEIAMTARNILYRNQEIASLGENEEVVLSHRYRHMELELGELLTNPKFIYGYRS